MIQFFFHEFVDHNEANSTKCLPVIFMLKYGNNSTSLSEYLAEKFEESIFLI